MGRRIDADALCLGKFPETRTDYHIGWNDALDAATTQAPTVDVVSKGLFDQIQWERDVAIAQLKEIGCELGQKMDDVVPVVRCKDCRFYRESEHPERRGIKFCYRLKHPTENRRIGYNYSDDDFCSCGERKEE